MFEQGGIGLYLFFESGNDGLGIIQGYADVGLGQVAHTVKSMGRLLIIIVEEDTRLSLADRFSDLVQVAVQKIQLAGLCLDPGPAINPGTPFIKTSDRGRLVR